MLALKNAGKRLRAESTFSRRRLLIRKDEKTALVGANGTGKTTLMKILAGLEDASTYGTLDQTRASASAISAGGAAAHGPDRC